MSTGAAGTSADVEDGRPHGPILIDGNERGLGFTFGEDPATGEPVYRPGSGVVAGDGTQENPFVIAGWKLPSIEIRNTTSHLTIRNVTVTGPLQTESIASAEFQEAYCCPMLAAGIPPEVSARRPVTLVNVSNVTLSHSDITQREPVPADSPFEPDQHRIGVFDYDIVAQTEDPGYPRKASIHAEGIRDLTIRKVNVTHAWIGIDVEEARDIHVEGSRINRTGPNAGTNREQGAVHLHDVDGSTLLENDISGYEALVANDGSDLTFLRNAVGEDAEINVFGYDGVEVANNTVSANLFAKSESFILRDNQFQGSRVKVYGPQPLLANNTLGAVTLIRTDAAVLSNNTVHTYAKILSAENTVVAWNTFDTPLEIDESRGTSLLDNEIRSPGVLLDGRDLEDFVLDEVRGNTVEGEPLAYVRGPSDETIVADGAQLIIVEATNLTLLSPSDATTRPWIQLAHSRDVTMDGLEAHRVQATAVNGLDASRIDIETRFEVVRGSDSTIDDGRVDGFVKLASVTNATVSRTEFPEGQRSVHVFDSRGVEIEENTVGMTTYERTDPRGSIWFDGVSDGSVRNNELHPAAGFDNAGTRGIQVTDSTDVVVEGNLVQGTHNGVATWGSRNLLIANNTLEANDQGVLFTDRISARDPLAIDVEYNELFHNGAGVKIAWAADESVVEIHQNNVEDNEKGIAGANDWEPLDARHNWWGCPEGPDAEACDPVDGNVLVEPWLEAPALDAGAD